MRRFEGDNIIIENRYDFLSLKDVRFDCSFVKFDANGSQTITSKTIKGLDIAPGQKGSIQIGPAPKDAEALTIKATDNTGMEIFTWVFKMNDTNYDILAHKENRMRKPCPTYSDGVVNADGTTFTFSTKDGTLQSVKTINGEYKFGNGPRFFAYRRSDRSFDQFYNHDDSEAEKKKTTYTEYEDQGVFDKLTAKEGENDTLIVTASYRLGSLEKAEWHIAPNGTARLVYSYNFNGVVDLMGIKFDMPEGDVKNKQWLGYGPYRVWKNRLHGPQLGVWSNDYNDPIPGESFEYPEFKGYFAGVQWMKIGTNNGTITMKPADDTEYVGVFQPRDGRDRLLYTLPETGISFMQVIPAVRNKVNTTDLNGPSAQAVWVRGKHIGEVTFRFD